MNNRKRATPVKDQVRATSTIEKRCMDGSKTCSDTGVFDLGDNRKNVVIPVSEKYTLTIKEAAAYFNVGTKKLRRLAEENTDRFAVFSGNKYLIIRTKFEKFINESSEI